MAAVSCAIAYLNRARGANASPSRTERDRSGAHIRLEPSHRRPQHRAGICTRRRRRRIRWNMPTRSWATCRASACSTSAAARAKTRCCSPGAAPASPAWTSPPRCSRSRVSSSRRQRRGKRRALRHWLGARAALPRQVARFLAFGVAGAPSPRARRRGSGGVARPGSGRPRDFSGAGARLRAGSHAAPAGAVSARPTCRHTSARSLTAEAARFGPPLLAAGDSRVLAAIRQCHSRNTGGVSADSSRACVRRRPAAAVSRARAAGRPARDSRGS